MLSLSRVHVTDTLTYLLNRCILQLVRQLVDLETVNGELIRENQQLSTEKQALVSELNRAQGSSSDHLLRFAGGENLPEREGTKGASATGISGVKARGMAQPGPSAGELEGETRRPSLFEGQEGAQVPQEPDQSWSNASRCRQTSFSRRSYVASISPPPPPRSPAAAAHKLLKDAKDEYDKYHPASPRSLVSSPADWRPSQDPQDFQVRVMHKHMDLISFFKHSAGGNGCSSRYCRI